MEKTISRQKLKYLDKILGGNGKQSMKSTKWIYENFGQKQEEKIINIKDYMLLNDYLKNNNVNFIKTKNKNIVLLKETETSYTQYKLDNFQNYIVNLKWENSLYIFEDENIKKMLESKEV